MVPDHVRLDFNMFLMSEDNGTIDHKLCHRILEKVMAGQSPDLGETSLFEDVKEWVISRGASPYLAL